MFWQTFKEIMTTNHNQLMDKNIKGTSSTSETSFIFGTKPKVISVDCDQVLNLVAGSCSQKFRMLFCFMQVLFNFQCLLVGNFSQNNSFNSFSAYLTFLVLGCALLSLGAKRAPKHKIRYLHHSIMKLFQHSYIFA